MRTSIDPLIHDPDDVPPKRRPAGFYFCGQGKDDCVPVGGSLEEQEHPIPLPASCVPDDDSATAVIIRGCGEHPEGDILGGSIPAVNDDDDDAEESRDKSDDTIDYTFPVIHEGISNEEEDC